MIAGEAGNSLEFALPLQSLTEITNLFFLTLTAERQKKTLNPTLKGYRSTYIVED
jgi:hypothetical protein